MLDGSIRIAFGLTEPKHGSDATWMETRGGARRRRLAHQWREDVEHRRACRHARHGVRAHQRQGRRRAGITCFIVPTNSAGLKIEEYLWTFNMPTDHPRVSFKDVWVPDGAVFGDPDNGLVLAQHFVHENRIRQAASALGAAQYCINESVEYANERKPFGKPLATIRRSSGRWSNCRPRRR